MVPYENGPSTKRNQFYCIGNCLDITLLRATIVSFAHIFLTPLILFLLLTRILRLCFLGTLTNSNWPTRGNNTLDQAFSTLLSYHESIILLPVASSDHSSVLLQPTGKPTPNLPTMRFHKRDDGRASNKRHLIVALENFNWTPIMRLNSCEHQLEAF